MRRKQFGRTTQGNRVRGASQGKRFFLALFAIPVRPLFSGYPDRCVQAGAWCWVGLDDGEMEPFQVAGEIFGTPPMAWEHVFDATMAAVNGLNMKLAATMRATRRMYPFVRDTEPFCTCRIEDRLVGHQQGIFLDDRFRHGCDGFDGD